MVEFTLSEADIDAAIARGLGERAIAPVPSSVRYDAVSGRVVVEFINGAVFMVPARALQDLADASDDDLAEVSLLGETGLHWETLDVDFSIAGLMSGVFGTASFMEMSRRGGIAEPAATVAAARENDARGERIRSTS